MDPNAVMKIAISVLATGMTAIGAVYTAHPGPAPAMTYVAAVCTTVGGYLLGLYQVKPGAA